MKDHVFDANVSSCQLPFCTSGRRHFNSSLSFCGHVRGRGNGIGPVVARLEPVARTTAVPPVASSSVRQTDIPHALSNPQLSILVLEII